MARHLTHIPTVRHYIAGGTEHGGGISRLVGYVLGSDRTRFRHVVVDTRGPRWSPLLSPFHLLFALLAMTAGAIQRDPSLNQLHIAGRGSTIRKLVLAFWARIIAAPYVLHLHDYDYADDIARRPEWQQRAIRTMFRKADHVLVLGQRDADTVGRILGVPESRIGILRNCVPDPGPREPAPNPQVKILFLGQLGPRKGVPELLNALAADALADDSWHAILAGDGPVDHYCEEARRLGLSDRVTFAGWVDTDRAARLRAQADILVLPSHGEGFAMAVLEGLAQGIAVVATPVGAHGEALVDDVNSLLVEPGDVDALATALARLVRVPALRDRIGAEGRRLYLRQFDLDLYVPALEAIQAMLMPGADPEQRSA